MDMAARICIAVVSCVKKQTSKTCLNMSQRLWRAAKERGERPS
jgi:hypothetical protein